MHPAEPSSLRYDRRTVAFHWATAVLVLLQWGGGQLTGFVPRGFLRSGAWSVHIVLGVALLLLLVARIAWRANRGRRLPPADEGVLNLIAKATHWGLYALLAAVVLLGLANAVAHGSTLFGLVNIPKFDAGDSTLPRAINGWHSLAANALLVLAGLHAAAALMHATLWRDGVLSRMLPGLNRA